MVGQKHYKEVIYHIIVFLGALIMIYPLLWMVLSSFKPTETVLPTAASLVPSTWTLENYIQGWKGFMGYTFGTFFLNSFIIALSSTFGTLMSSAFVAYALQRLKFKLRGLFFVLVLSTMIALCGQGLFPAWACIVVLFRELAVDGLRLIAVEQGRVIAAGKLGKIKTSLQMVTLVLYLLSSCGATLFAPVAEIMMLAAVLMTVWSGVDYFVKNREVLHDGGSKPGV